MNKFQLLYDAQMKKARSRQPVNNDLLKKKNFSKLARTYLPVNELNYGVCGKTSNRKSISSSQLSTAQISDRNKKTGTIESSVLKIEKQKQRPISIEKLHLDHSSRQPSRVKPSLRQSKYSQKLFFASDIADKKPTPYRSSQTQMSNRSGKTPKAEPTLFSTQRTTAKNANVLSPTYGQDSHQRSLIQSKISKIFGKNKSVDMMPKRKPVKSTGGSVGSNQSQASKASNTKLTTLPTTACIGLKLQTNKSKLMMPSKIENQSSISRQKVFQTAKVVEQFNQTFGVQVPKNLHLVPKVLKLKKAPQVSSYQEIPHCDDYSDKTQKRRKQVQTATELIKMNQDQINLKATPKILKDQNIKKKYSKHNKENCLFKIYGDRFSNEGLKKKQSILSPKPFSPVTSSISYSRPIPQSSRNPTLTKNALGNANFFLRVSQGSCGGHQPPSKSSVEQVCQSPQDITGTSNSNSWSQLPSMSTDSKKVNVPVDMHIKTMIYVSEQMKVLKKIRPIASPHGSLTGIQAAPSIMEYDKTTKSVHQVTQEPTDEMAAQPYDLETNFTPVAKEGSPVHEIRELSIHSYEEPNVSRRASIINIDIGVQSEKSSSSEVEMKPEIMNLIDKTRMFQQQLQEIKIQSEQQTTNGKSEEKEEMCLDHALVDISEAKQKELEKSQELYQVNQDSLINGTFRLDNTQSLEKFREIENHAHSLEKFKEIEKLCEVDSETRNNQTQQIQSHQLQQVVSVENIDAAPVKFEPCDDYLRAPSLQTCHFNQTVNTMTNLHLLAPYQEDYLNITPVNLPEPTKAQIGYWMGTTPKVIFIDIDETMVHCLDDRDPPEMQGQLSLNIMLQTQECLQIDINLRPGLRESLKMLKQFYQIVSFTASDQLYADTILNFIDPNNEIFSMRLYRQHCVETEYGLIKDLRIVKNRDLKDLMIVDNSALSFSLNVLNGVPILPYYDNPQDEELRHLTYYLMGLKDVIADDVRQHNDQAFGLMRLGQLQPKPPILIEEQTYQEQNRASEQNSFVDQPINMLSLINTNNIIEERSNEDGGETSSQVSPELIQRHRKRIYLSQVSSGNSQDNLSEGSQFDSKQQNSQQS